MYSAFGVDHGDFSKSRASEGKAYRKKSDHAALGSIGGTVAGYTGAHVAMAAHDNKKFHEGEARWQTRSAKSHKDLGLHHMNEASRHIGEYRANPEGYRPTKLTWHAADANKSAVEHLGDAKRLGEGAARDVKAAKKAKNWRTAGIAAGVGGLGASVGGIARSVHFDNKAKAKGQ